MAGFSIDAALKSGFGLARREWMAVLAWGVAYMTFALAMQAISLGPALPEYLRLLTSDPEAASALANRSAEGAYAFISIPLVLILSVAASAVLYGAIARALLEPHERRGFFIRFSKRELWLGLTTAVYLCAALLIAAVILFLAASLVGLLGNSALLWLLLGPPAGLASLYLVLRFSTAWVQAFAEERFVFWDAWRLTRGQGWRLVLMSLALIFLSLIVTVVVLIPAVIVLAIIGAVAAMATGANSVPYAIGMVSGFALITLGAGFFFAVAGAPYVEVYRALRGSAALPDGQTVEEVFA